ncbi:uncharacterized protein [Blastocystis hominis]|uniref:Uncharacterized protein n=1 Tax=Blastocystis hominis TaxID=12968 RepID=D8M2G0_BLAHO|nr:uncharacterized protein [Blastocystis hominis]CBK22249.2 unnamed protein product [Blastocystis hominis]|eukprot:XP_012896297.1 uncharacterized protein [Blastocystis hominis]
MSRVAFSSFARGVSRLQSIRQCTTRGLNPMFMKMRVNSRPMNALFPELAAKNLKLTQLSKLSTNSRRLACLQLQKIQLCALSLLITNAGEILIDFQDMMHSLEEEEEEELLRRTSLLVQTQRLV